MTAAHEVTGPHLAIPPPPPSEPPISSRGVAWRTVGAAIGIMAAIAVPTAAALVGYGRTIAEIEQLRDEVRAMRSISVEQQEQATTLAVLRRDVDTLERDLAEVRRRSHERAHDR
jgi:hypothetical protein